MVAILSRPQCVNLQGTSKDLLKETVLLKKVYCCCCCYYYHYYYYHYHYHYYYYYYYYYYYFKPWIPNVFNFIGVCRTSSIIQIKIYTEYWGMLPRPRLVCQESGLMPIGRSPCVPAKFSRGLGSMSRYSAQILICFLAHSFQCSIPMWVWLGTL